MLEYRRVVLKWALQEVDEKPGQPLLKVGDCIQEVDKLSLIGLPPDVCEDTFGASFRHGAWLMALSGQEAGVDLNDLDAAEFAYDRFYSKHALLQAQDEASLRSSLQEARAAGVEASVLAEAEARLRTLTAERELADAGAGPPRTLDRELSNVDSPRSLGRWALGCDDAMSGPATSSKAALLHDLEKKRQEREKLRQSNAKEAAEETQKHTAALRIQSFVRSVLARSRWADSEWKSIQKQVQDLQTLAKIVQMKGQPFLAPGKVLLTLMRRTHWQVWKHLALRSADDLAEVLCALSGFVLDALRVSHRDVHRSICYLMTDGMEKSAHAPAAAWTLYSFCAALLHLATTGARRPSSGCTTTWAAAAAKSLAQLLDVAAWGDGSAVEIPAISAFASFLLQRLADPQRLHSWRVCASGCAWGHGDAPEKLQQLVAVQVALLRLGFLSVQDRGNAAPRGVVAAALQAALAVPRVAGPLAKQFAALPRKDKVVEDLVWSDVLAQLPQRYQESGQHRQGSAKALEQEYAMAYAAGNLLELHGELQLPLAALLPVLALLVERAVEVSMLPGSASSGDEPVALQELRRQLKAMAEPAAVVRMWSDILCLRFRPKENLIVPLRGYQRHCLAVVSHQVCPKAVSSLAQLYSVLLSKARAAAKAGSNHQVFQGIANAIAYMEGGDVPKVLWRHIESVITDMDPLQLKANELHLLHLQALLVSQTLGVLSSEELQGASAPLCRHDMPGYVAKVSALASTIAWTSSGSQIREELLETAGRVLAQLYRICDRKWVPVQNWHAPEPILDGFKAAMKELTEHLQLRSPEPRTLPPAAERLLRHVPQAIPFEQRVALLRARGKAVAVIGGGISGVVAAQTLSAQHEVVLFDFGSRGLGGRCGHREDPKDGLRFDHGAQFLSVGATDSERICLPSETGNAAHHEASEADAQAADDQYLGSFKVLILTDVMLSFPEWHRAALLGLEAHVPELVGVLKETDTRQPCRHGKTDMAPLFSLMVSFELGATENVDLDAAVIRTSPVLQWICRMIFGGHIVAPMGSYLKSCSLRVAVCVSTREFAEACLGDEPMSVEGAKGIIYKPQEKESGFARCF
eukprot:s608_g18.t2